MKKLLIFSVCLVLLIATCFASGSIVNVNANYAEGLFSKFTSKSYVLLDADSGTVLVTKNADAKMQVASICKLMTTLITMEKVDAGIISLNDEVMASEHAASMEGSQAFLDAGSKYKLSELLKSVIVASANDSAVALAEAIAGSEQAFVNMMNDRAKELGMHNTIYANSTGLPAPEQYSTAMDTAIVLKQATNHDIYKQYSNIWMDKFEHPSGRTTELVNTNRLIKYYDYCKSGKTGFTDEAGYCLASTASNDNLNLVSVTLKCDNAGDRFKESMELFNHGFANYENRKVVSKDVPHEMQIKVNGGKQTAVKIVYKNDFSVVTKKGDKEEIKIKINVKNSVKAPVAHEQIVGIATIVKNGKVMGEVDIVTIESVAKQNYGDIINKVVNDWELIA